MTIKTTDTTIIANLVLIGTLIALMLAFAAGEAQRPPRPAPPSVLVVIRDGAPSWCLDPSYPRGDMWYESCAEPVR